jgi:hypothetical protein
MSPPFVQTSGTVFERFAAPIGGAFHAGSDLDPALVPFVGFMQRCHGRALQHIRKFGLNPATPLESGWVWRGEFGAKAGAIDGVDCIAVYLGLPHILLNFFRAMLGHRAVLPHIGISSREVNTRYQPERKADLSKVLRVTAPRDPARARYVLELCYCAFHFIYLHEFAHLFHGHVDWRERNSGALPIQLQTLEFDADAFAGTDLLRAVLGTKNDPVNRRHAVSTAVFAVYCLFRIHSNKLLDDDSFYRAGHPPMIFRQRSFLGGLTEMVYEEKLISMPELGKIIVQAMVEAEEAYSLLTGSQPLDAPQMVEGFERGHELLDRLLATWEKLMPELELLKQGGELTPANWNERNTPFVPR